MNERSSRRPPFFVRLSVSASLSVLPLPGEEENDEDEDEDAAAGGGGDDNDDDEGVCDSTLELDIVSRPTREAVIVCMRSRCRGSPLLDSPRPSLPFDVNATRSATRDSPTRGFKSFKASSPLTCKTSTA